MAGIGDKSLENIATAVRDTWQILASILGFDSAETDSIEAAMEGQETDQARHMLRVWRDDRYGGVDEAGCLIGALRQLGRYDLLNELGEQITIKFQSASSN